MSKNSWLALGLLTVAVVLVGLALTDGDELAPGATGSTTPTGSEASTGPNEAAPPGSAAGEALVGSTDQPAPSPSSEREAVAARETDESFLLECTGPSGQPLGELDVWLIRSPDGEVADAHEDPLRADAYFEQEGQLFRVGSTGSVRLPTAGEGETYLVGRGEGLWGTLVIPELSQPSYTLQLHADHALRVQLLSSRGEPLVDLPVRLQLASADWTINLAEQRTADGAGIAVFPHCQSLVRPGKPGIHRVAAGVLSPEPIAHEVDPEALPAEVIVLELPPLGSVEVRILDEELREYRGEATVQLECIPEGEPRQLSPFDPRTREKLEAEAAGGIASFPHVPLGLELAAAVQRAGSEVGTRGYGPGPNREAQVSTLEVQLGQDHPVARIRAVDGDGAPMQSVELTGEVDLRTPHYQTSESLRSRTDEEGYFLVDLNHDWSEGSSRRLSVRVLEASDSRIRGTLDLSASLENGLNELGDIALVEALPLARGRVQTETGEPVPGAALYLRSRARDQAGWQNLGDFELSSGADGTFTIEEDLMGESFRIAASKSGLASGWFEFEPRDEEVVVVMTPHGQIAGSLLLDASIPRRLIHVSVDELQDGEEFLPWWNRRASPGEDGSFLFQSLKPGPRRVTVRANQLREPLFEVEGIEVLAGELNRDPRLQNIDLRRKLFQHEVVLEHPDNKRYLEGFAAYGPAGAEELENRHALNEGRFVLFSSHEVIDLEVSASGFRTELRKGVAGAVTIPLRRGPSLTLAITGEAELPSAPIFLRAALRPAGSDSNQIDLDVAAFDERREIGLRAPGPGKMEIVWIVEHRRSEDSAMASIAKLERQWTIEVLDFDEGQHFEVELSPADMKEILTNLP